MKKFLPFFLIIVLGDLLSIIFSNHVGEMFFKPCIMLALGFYINFQMKSRVIPNSSRLFLQLAIGFSLLGDILLLNADWFVLGLLAFLMAHIFYIMVFRKDNNVSVLKQRDRYGAVIAILIYTLLFSMYLADKLGAMLIPVLFYSAVITVMLLTVLNRWRYVSDESFRWAMVGAVLFAFSDSLIAINKFAFSFPYSGIFVMLTYSIGQFLILEGFLKNQKVE